MELTAVLTPTEEGGYVALNPETGTTTQGETVEEAVANLKEATALYLAEYQYRFNRRFDLSILMQRLIRAAANAKPAPMRSLRMAEDCR